MPAEKNIKETLESIKRIQPGELVVVEYSSLDPVHLVVLLIILSRRDEMNVIVSDIFDQLHVVLSHLKIMGIQTGWVNEIPVIKFGGIMPRGSVIRRISLLDTPFVWHMEYMEAVKTIQGMKLVVTLGFEKLITIKPEIPASTVCRLLLTSCPDDEIKIVFVNRDMLTESILEDIREPATRVFRLGFAGRKLTLTIVKSLSLKNYGKTFSVDTGELVAYLTQLTQKAGNPRQ